MKDLIKQYLDHGTSRRQLMTGLSALGMSTVAARSVAQSCSDGYVRAWVDHENGGCGCGA
jgi:hypothetical protein